LKPKTNGDSGDGGEAARCRDGGGMAKKMRPANNQTYWQMSAAFQLGPKPWFSICAGNR
jgi:hypothetical protein